MSVRLLAVLLVPLLLASSASAAWVGFHGDERNTGFQSGTSFQAYEDVWWTKKVAAATQIESTPVVKDGVLIVTSWDHGVRAYDAESGKAKWNVTPTRASTVKYTATPAIANNRVFVVDEAGKLEARDLQKGTLLDTATVGATLASPTVHEGKLYIGNEAGDMQAFDTQTLTLLWKFSISSVSDTTTTTGTGMSAKTSCGVKFSSTGSQIRSTPAVFGGNVIFASLNHWVYAVKDQGDTAQKTDLRWIFQTGDAIFGSPTVDSTSGRVLIGSYDEKVYSLPAAPAGQGPIEIEAKACTALKNTASWNFVVPSTIGLSKVHSTIAIDESKAYFGANNGRVYAVHLSNGQKVWEFTTGNQVISSPAVSNGVVVVGSDDKSVYWLNAGNGTQIKSFLTDGTVRANPVIDGNKTFVASFEGSIYMFGPAIPKRPDLQVTAVTYTGGQITVTVKNAGNAEAPASKVRISIDGVFAKDLDVPTIAAGKSETVAFKEKLGSGTHAVTADADNGAKVTESIETNNAKTAQLSEKTDTAPTKKEDKGFLGIPSVAPGLVILGLALLALARRK